MRYIILLSLLLTVFESDTEWFARTYDTTYDYSPDMYELVFDVLQAERNK